MIFQLILLSIFAFNFLAGIILLLKKIKLSGSFLVTLSAIGFIVAAVPDLSTMAANHLGIGRGADLILYLWSMLNFLLVGLLLTKIYKLEASQMEAIRTISIKLFELESKNKK